MEIQEDQEEETQNTLLTGSNFDEQPEEEPQEMEEQEEEVPEPKPAVKSPGKPRAPLPAVKSSQKPAVNKSIANQSKAKPASLAPIRSTPVKKTNAAKRKVDQMETNEYDESSLKAEEGEPNWNELDSDSEEAYDLATDLMYDSKDVKATLGNLKALLAKYNKLDRKTIKHVFVSMILAEDSYVFFLDLRTVEELLGGVEKLFVTAAIDPKELKKSKRCRIIRRAHINQIIDVASQKDGSKDGEVFVGDYVKAVTPKAPYDIAFVVQIADDDT